MLLGSFIILEFSHLRHSVSKLARQLDCISLFHFALWLSKVDICSISHCSLCHLLYSFDLSFLVSLRAIIFALSSFDSFCIWGKRVQSALFIYDSIFASLYWSIKIVTVTFFLVKYALCIQLWFVDLSKLRLNLLLLLLVFKGRWFTLDLCQLAHIVQPICNFQSNFVWQRSLCTGICRLCRLSVLLNWWFWISLTDRLFQCDCTDLI